MRDKTKTSSPSLLPLGLLNFFIYGTMVIFIAFFQLYLQDIGMDKLEIGSLMAIGPFISLLAHPTWRILSDYRQNPRAILLIMMTGLLVVGYLVFRANTFHMLYLLMILLYFFQSPLLSQTNSLTLSYTEVAKRKFRHFRLWGSFGWAFIALGAGPVIDATGHYGILQLFSISLILAIAAAFILPSIRHTSYTPWLNYPDMKRTLQNKYFVAFVVFGFLVSIPNSINGIFLPLFINDFGGSRLQVGVAVFFSTAFEALVFVLLNRYLKRKLTYLLACITIVSLLFALRWDLMSDATGPVQIMFIQLLHSVTFGGFFYVGTQLITLFLPRPLCSAGQAIYAFSLSGLSGIFAGVLGGWIFQNFGPVIMYKIGVVLTLIGALGYAAMWYRICNKEYATQTSFPKEP